MKKPDIKIFEMETFTLLLSEKPCDVFRHFNVQEMHGLSYLKCVVHKNTKHQAYIAGFSNYVPNEKKKYKHGDPFFVFINLSRCNSELDTCLLVNHEMMHRAFELFNWNVDMEEDMITWAEKETRKVIDIIFNLNEEEESEDDDEDDY